MIDFYEAKEPFGELSNYYVCTQPILYDGKTYASSEHLYQSLKFIYDGASPESIAYAETVRKAKTPNMSKILAMLKIGGGYAWRLALNPIISKALADKVTRNPHWEQIKDAKMEMVLQLKFQQDSHCRKVLLSTGTSKLAEHTNRDFYWGDGGESRSGKNMLGVLLMKTREKIQEEKKRKAEESGEQAEKDDTVAASVASQTENIKEKPKQILDWIAKKRAKNME